MMIIRDYYRSRRYIIYSIDEYEYTSDTDESNCLILSNIPTDIDRDVITSVFNDMSSSMNISPPTDIQLISTLNIAYIIYSDIHQAKSILYRCKGKINIRNNVMDMDFYQMNLSRHNISNIDDTLLQDWICDKVCVYYS